MPTKRSFSVVRTLARPAALLPVLALVAAPAAAQIGARPQAAAAAPPPLCVRDVRLGLADDAERVTLRLEHGRIAERLDADAPLPPGHVEIDGSDLLALPAFVDAFTTRGVETPRPTADRDASKDPRADVLVDMRPALRRGLQPSFRAVDVAALSDEHLLAWRAAGFGYALQSPAGELLSGQAVLVSLREGALRDRVVAPVAAHHASFSSTGSGYPGTLMGGFAHLRQFVLDAEHRAELARRRDADRPGPRPPHDPDLEAAAALSAGSVPVLCAAESATDARRWVRFAEELGWSLVLLGMREAGEEAERLAARRVPVVLTLDWGDEVTDPRKPAEKPRARRGERAATDDEEEADEEPATPPEDAPEGEEVPDESAPEDEDAEDPTADDDSALSAYREPFEVRLARRLEWEERRDGAKVLEATGVPFVFGSADDGPAELLGRVRQLVEAGLDQEVALAALSRRAGDLFGEPTIGRLEVGADASLALWTANPLVDEKARVAWLVVEGHAWRAPPEKDAKAKKEEQR